MAKLSERVKDITPMDTASTQAEFKADCDDLERAASICALVEAFQAAEQAYREARADGEVGWIGSAAVNLTAAKARLLEVNLG